MVAGTKDDAQALKEEIAGVLTGMGLRLSPEKTLITHIDEGLGFLGWRIQRHRKRGTGQHYVYTYPARKAVKAVMGKVRTMCREMDTSQPLDAVGVVAERGFQGSQGLVGSRSWRMPAMVFQARAGGCDAGDHAVGGDLAGHARRPWAEQDHGGSQAAAGVQDAARRVPKTYATRRYS
jgi:hypothetical protein